MKKLKNILKIMKNKSNIDYKYYHLFNNKNLDLNYNTNNFTINYIIYIINSDFSHFYAFYKKIIKESITDVFLERLNLSKEDKFNLFSMKFNNIFWLKINNIQFLENDYDWFISFLSNNNIDINRIFLENTYLNVEFFHKFWNLKWFDKLSFLNFDNNHIYDEWLESIIKFIKNNNINLEYLSLINTHIWDVNNLLDILFLSKIRILDLSSNNLINNNSLINFIQNNNTINELYLRNIKFSDIEIESILNVFKKNKSKIYNLRLSLNNEQIKYKEDFKLLEKNLNINFDINILWESEINIFSTVYIKEPDKEELDLKVLSNEYFYIINANNREEEFNKLVNNKYLKDAINLFLFDFNDYKKIDTLLSNYNFNYLYIENYFINDKDFIYFLDSIKKQKHKKYKINLISIELSEYQLNYLIDTFPENIFYIEVNLNKIDENRELYIIKMLKNKAFIFENIEFYQKIFK